MTDLDKLCNDAVSLYNAGQESEAIDLLDQLAKRGCAQAMTNAGIICENTGGKDRDWWLRQAVYWYRKAAKLGDAQAQLNLTWMYRDGKGVRKDYKKALMWLVAVAEQEDIGVDEKTIQEIKRALANEDEGSMELSI